MTTQGTLNPQFHSFLNTEEDSREGNYYVSILHSDGKRFMLALGPFPTHREALERVRDVKRFAERYPESHWYAYGTVRTESYSKLGSLNRVIGVLVQG